MDDLKVGMGIFVANGNARNLVSPDSREAFMKDLDHSLEVHRVIGNNFATTLTGNVLKGVERADQKQAVIDNLKAAVISHRKGKVVLNESYADMGRHYGVAIVPARPYHPQDKGKVEAGVKGIQRWILMKLRHRTFFDIDELNEAIDKLLEAYNHKVIRRIGKSRRELFETIDKAALHPLRSQPYVYREHKRATVGIDYHIELGGCGYSVPYTYVGKKVDIWYSSTHVSVVCQGETIAVHPRASHPHHDSTLKAHMPLQHRFEYEKYNPKRILGWAESIGVQTTALMEEIMADGSHAVRGYRSCIAILNFAKPYGNEALEQACKRARELNIRRVESIESMLKRKTYLGDSDASSPAHHTPLNHHGNLRDAAIYR